MGELRAFDEAQQEEDIKDEYEVMSISSSDFINSIEFLKESFDIIVVDFPGNLKQAGVVETLMMMDVVIIPFAPYKNRSIAHCKVLQLLQGKYLI